MMAFPSGQKARVKSMTVAAVMVVAAAVGMGGNAGAVTLCVNTGGTNGCKSTIQAAIDAVVSPSTTIVVHPGHYTATCGTPACSVAAVTTVTSPSPLDGLTLECRHVSGRSVVLDATGLDHAIYVSGVNAVTIAGCVAENAQREGILVENSTSDKIADNEVVKNDLAMGQTLGKGTPACPTFEPSTVPGAITCCPDAFSGGPGNFPDDNDDCGEGIHLRGVTNSVVRNNLVHGNIGGILLTDETGHNANNLLVGNTSEHNRRFGGDCGATLASHTACDAGSTDMTGCSTTTTPPAPYGVFHNAVVGNVLVDNGASGAGVFANPGAPPGAATKAYGNLISDNVITDNGQPGVGIHVHAANGNVDHNVIVENVLSGNGGDPDPDAEGSATTTTGIELLSDGKLAHFSAASPITGTIISQNRISHEDIDVWVGNTATNARAFLNDLKGQTGVENEGTGTIVATDNWWGCPQGPGGGPSCSKVGGTGSASVISTPFLSHPISPEK